MRFVRGFPLAPLLLALYGVLVLLANNIDQINGIQAIRSLVISLIVAGALMSVFAIVFRNWHRAALAASLIILLFFTYGHAYGYLKQVQISSILIGRHRFLIPLWIGLLALGLYWLSKRIQDPAPISGLLNLIAGILIFFPLSAIVVFSVRSRSIQPQSAPQNLADCDLTIPSDSQPPDIYYIILDEYARGDDLRTNFGYDNSLFLNNLRNMGFFVAGRSQSNYTYTLLSITSSTNLNYLQDLDDRIYAGAPFDIAPLWQLLGQNIVRRNLECIGYTVVSFDSGLHAYGWRDADVYISSKTTSFADQLELSRGINAFESMLLQSSAALVLTDAATLLPKYLQIDTSAPFEDHRLRMLYQLDSLESVVPAIEGPKFVFAHILATHRPYVFGPGGEPLDDLEGQFTLSEADLGISVDQERARYLGQISYINSRIENVIREILQASKIPPIIIIQSDHGYRQGGVVGTNILNAYYLPGGGDQLLFDTISPVNSFRIIFDYYFEGRYGVLDDVSYSSPFNSFHFTAVQNIHLDE